MSVAFGAQNDSLECFSARYAPFPPSGRGFAGGPPETYAVRCMASASVRRVLPLLAALSVVSLVLLGVVGVGHFGTKALIDSDCYYAAGRCWLSGSSMYDPVAFTREMQALGYDRHGATLPYSPAFAPLGMALATLPYSAACLAVWILNLVGVACLCLVGIRLARTSTGEARPGTSWLLVCVVAGMPLTAKAVWLGQLTIWMAALTCAAWCALRERRTLVAGLLLGLTSIKPQFSLFLVFWLVLEREWKVLAIAGGVALGLCAYAMIALGPLEPFEHFLGGVAHYADPGHDADSLGNVHVMGLPSLLTTAGVEGLHVTPFIALTGVLVLLAWLGRRKLPAECVLALLMILQMALVYAHDIEAVFLVPVWAWFWMRFGPRSRWSYASLALLLVLSLPKWMVTSATTGLLLQWRSVTLLALLALVIASARSPDQARDRR